MKQAPSNLQKKAGRYFELYPQSKSFFVTSDGNVFKNASLARNHKNCSKKEIECFEVKNPALEEADVDVELQQKIDKFVDDNTREELNKLALEKGMAEDEVKAIATKAQLAEAILKLEE